jgi:hypothetical protein
VDLTRLFIVSLGAVPHSLSLSLSRPQVHLAPLLPLVLFSPSQAAPWAFSVNQVKGASTGPTSPSVSAFTPLASVKNGNILTQILYRRYYEHGTRSRAPPALKTLFLMPQTRPSSLRLLHLGNLSKSSRHRWRPTARKPWHRLLNLSGLVVVSLGFTRASFLGYVRSVRLVVCLAVLWALELTCMRISTGLD